MSSPSTVGDLSRVAAPVAVLVGAIGVCAFVGATDPTTPGGMSPPCPTKALFGIVCPGCGSARMLYSLIHGDFRAALAYNAVGLILLLLIGWMFIAWSVSRISGRRLPRWETRRWSMIVLVAVIVLWGIIRNLPFAPFSALAV